MILCTFVACAVTAACAPAADDRTTTSGSAPPPPNVFDPAIVQIGDTVVGLVIEDLRRERASTGEWVGSARFVGPLSLAGRTVAHPDGADYPFPCFEADSASALKLPRWKGDERRPWLCFENSAEARSALGAPTPGRPFSIRIERFTIHRNLTDAVNSARLVGAGPDDSSAANTATQCFRTSESVLARRPGTVADGPAGVSGWIRLDGDASADSGTGRLVDSDGRSLGVRWRRISPDSVAVSGFDDFLRVEMRLATRDDQATGFARAHSDAALERDSSGKMVEFRREWPVLAHRVSCDSMPARGRRE